jgi:LacI family transcriptional regulator, repressor for deo operon, udp, cdd, tsx, nupC, and nupG
VKANPPRRPPARQAQRPTTEVSIRTIARRAGVSTATVSRVVNGSDVVAASTRKRVEAAVAELGYQSNVLGRNLRIAQSRLLLTLLPDFGNPFYAEIVRGIDQTARKQGYNVLLCDTGASLPGERTYFDLLRSRIADGAICLDPEATQRALAEETGRLCWVACSEYALDSAVPYVGIDDARAAHEAVTYLAQRGRRRIAFLNSDERYSYARQRRRGYLKALGAAGLTPPEGGLLVASGVSFEDGYRCVKAYLVSARARPDAIFAVSDSLAVGAMHALRTVGLRVPDDVGVVGFDDVAIATMAEPQLTTVRQPMQQLGETAAELLLERLRDPKAEVEGILLKHKLVVRASA